MQQKREKEELCADLDRKCTELQMLKFGKLIDVDMLQESHINTAAEELKVCVFGTGFSNIMLSCDDE